MAGVGGWLSTKALLYVAGNGAVEWHLKGVFSVEDGLYAVLLYRGCLFYTHVLRGIYFFFPPILSLNFF